jgi:RNA polymerase sigma factor (sigma-70 family)
VADLPDEIIMQRVKDGNLDEMSVIFERYHIKLYNFFLKLTRDRDASQDLTQNLFYRLIKYKNSYKSDLSVQSWIYQMARNLHIDYFNEEKRSDAVFMKTETYPVDIHENSDGFAEEDYERLDQAFSELTEEQKEIIVMSRYQGLKYEEISKITSKSVPAIKVVIHRAIKQLRGIYFKQT